MSRAHTLADEHMCARSLDTHTCTRACAHRTRAHAHDHVMANTCAHSARPRTPVYYNGRCINITRSTSASVSRHQRQLVYGCVRSGMGGAVIFFFFLVVGYAGLRGEANAM